MKLFKVLQSLHLKLVIVNVLLIVVGMQIIGLFFTNSLEQDLTSKFKESIDAQVQMESMQIKEVYKKNPDNQTKIKDEIQSLMADFREREEIEEIRFINENRIMLATSKVNNEPNIGRRVTDDSIDEALSTGESYRHVLMNEESNERIYVQAEPVKVGQEIVGVIYVVSNIETVYAQLNQINNTFIIGTAISLLITIILGTFIARTITKPISDMRNQALEMSKGNYTQRVKINSSDEIGELALSFNNLSKRVQEAQANTESEKRRLDSVITHMSDGIIATDRRGRIRIINDKALNMLRVDKDNIVGQHVLTVLNMESEVNLQDIKNETETIVTQFNHIDETIYVRINFTTIIQETGYINGYIAVLHDITEQQLTENERREFVANVSHELRTPLTSMRSYIEALEEGAWKDSNIAPNFLSVTRNETDRMIRLVNDLLQLSNMDRKDEVLNREIIDFNLFISQIIERFEMSYKEVDFVKDLANDSIFVEIDPDKMTQVFDNIISNAIKYSQKEQKRVEFHVKQNVFFNRMTISIKDNGLGIPKGKVDKIFDRFYRVDKARTRQMGGTGLGLAISKDIVEAHDGKIWATSCEGHGTTIYVTLPCELLEAGEWDAN
ncbi:cell wall metabolism sensor histidine kinase WalK [Abyssicoccus albus]|uniref:cell wall metabolism sensor histidine kinase WalK n=1 Tax=Abyssicoccus albus TaxID=1817405 RepID=UPI00097E28B5|nr:cell wall metabolism sensor histidine kinase WalK [Abyssicoccus albus]AQL55438.1 cell wall metabolism sensor histidine kinase WalK [Abyssicoccus albus]